MKKFLALLVLSLTVLSCFGFNLLQPAMNTTKQATPINFKWEPVDGATGYELMIMFYDFGFEEYEQDEDGICYLLKTNTNSVTFTKDLLKSTFKWRVTAIKKDGQKVMSKSSIFSLTENIIAEGQKIPDVTFEDMTGKPWKISDVAKANKVTWIELWATWCGPCRKSMPHVESLHQKYEKKGLKVVSVSVDKTREKPESFIKDNKYTFEYGWDGKKVSKILHAFFIPKCIIVDETGKILFVGDPTTVTDDMIEKFLKQ